MNARTGRLVAGAGLLVVAIVLLILLKGGGEESGGTDAGTAPTIVIENGKPLGGIREFSYEKGDRIRFEVKSDVADEVHVHGYDLMKDVKAGGTVAFDFPASIEGVFEAELEGRMEQIAALRVEP
jgi:hypothetical protein